MNYRFFLLGIAINFSSGAFGQSNQINQLRITVSQLAQKPGFEKDTQYLNTANKLVFEYAESYPDSALPLLQTQLNLCRRAQYTKGEIEALKISGNLYQNKGDFTKAGSFYSQAYDLAEKTKLKSALPGILNNIGLVLMNQGKYSEALGKYFETLKLAEQQDNRFVQAAAINNIATIYFYQGKYKQAADNYREMLTISQSIDNTSGIILAYSNLGEANLELGLKDTALQNLKTAYSIAQGINNPELMESTSRMIAKVYARYDSLPQARHFYETALNIARSMSYGVPTCQSLIGLAQLKIQENLPAKALVFGTEALQLAEDMGQANLQRDAQEIMAVIQADLGNYDIALDHYKNFKVFSDSINNLASARASEAYQSQYNFSKKELEFERRSLQQKWLIFSGIAGIISLLIIILLVNRNRQRLNKANQELNQQNVQIEKQKVSLESTLDQLKNTQTQLIHAEKMASMGELTAGIAHEIQNPLNFINNFAEVSRELIEELAELIDQRDTEEVKILAQEINGNLEKIETHGKRADNIVKSMLYHSRSSTNTREMTDINVLVKQYMHLSFHGLKAKERAFNAQMTITLDPAIKSLEVIPNEIGRALLNLFNNAFYAVGEKSKIKLNTENSVADSSDKYTPLVSVITHAAKDYIKIIIEDNGTGIRAALLSKIFMPFFTTKPSGSGTGLGLSLTYEIITKLHKGKLEVESEENLFTRFTVILPT